MSKYLPKLNIRFDLNTILIVFIFIILIVALYDSSKELFVKCEDCIDEPNCVEPGQVFPNGTCVDIGLLRPLSVGLDQCKDLPPGSQDLC